jgi:uncharacterized protein YpmB
VIKKPHERGGHSPRWAARSEIIIMIIIIIIYLKVISYTFRFTKGQKHVAYDSYINKAIKNVALGGNNYITLYQNHRTGWIKNSKYILVVLPFLFL